MELQEAPRYCEDCGRPMRIKKLWKYDPIKGERLVRKLEAECTIRFGWFFQHSEWYSIDGNQWYHYTI